MHPDVKLILRIESLEVTKLYCNIIAHRLWLNTFFFEKYTLLCRERRGLFSQEKRALETPVRVCKAKLSFADKRAGTAGNKFFAKIQLLQ